MAIGQIATPRPPRDVTPALPASTGLESRDSANGALYALGGGEGVGWPSSGAAGGGWCMQVRGDRSRRLFDRYKIGYSYSS